MVVSELKKNECLRCGHKWIQRVETKPVRCPVCKSPYWDKPKQIKSEEK
jgi:predicted Zn-ribbon and HTH transcriptional regulator